MRIGANYLVVVVMRRLAFVTTMHVTPRPVYMRMELDTFFVGGVLCGISKGSTLADVLHRFGEPDATRPQRRSNAALMKYGSVEVTLRDGFVLGIKVDYQGWEEERADDLSRSVLETLLRSQAVTWTTDEEITDYSDFRVHHVWLRTYAGMPLASALRATTTGASV